MSNPSAQTATTIDRNDAFILVGHFSTGLRSKTNAMPISSGVSESVWRSEPFRGPILFRQFDSVRVQSCRVNAVSIVTSSEEDNRRRANFPDRSQDHLIARAHIRVAQSHLTKEVIFMRVGTGNPKDEVRRKTAG